MTISILVLGILAVDHPNLSNVAQVNNSPHEALFHINAWNPQGNPVCTATYDQSGPRICIDGAGGAFITWYDIRNGLNSDIYAQRIDTSGVVQWTTNGVAICTKPADQNNPQLCSDGAGGIIVVWEDNRDGKWDLYAQRINASGVVQWTRNGTVICNETHNQFAPRLCSDGQGGAIITWNDYRRYDSTGNIDIYAQRVNESGMIQWTTTGLPICLGPSGTWDSNPEICSDGENGAIITWRDGRTVGSTGYDIYAQRINSNGVVNWTTNGVAICTAGNWQQFPYICSDGAGGAIIEWSDARLHPNYYDVVAQCVGPTGTVKWTSNGVPICTVCDLPDLDTALCNVGSGAAIITWTDNRSGTHNIYAQLISTGTVQWTTNGVAICTAANDKSNPQACYDGAGGAIITWIDARMGHAVYTQRVNGTGSIQWAINGIRVCEHSTQSLAPLCTDGGSGVLIVWEDFRTSNFDIYARRILPPSAPQLEDIVPSPNTDGNIFLEWSDSFGAENYSVYRSTSIITDTSSLTPIALISTGATNYTDSGLSNGLYYYIIVASNATGDSMSNCNSIQVALSGPNLGLLILLIFLFPIIGVSLGLIVLYYRRREEEQ